MDIGEIENNVKEVAQGQGIKTYSALAMKAGLYPRTVRKVWDKESFFLSFETLARLCAALKVRLSDLFEYNEPGDTNSPGKPTDADGETATPSSGDPVGGNDERGGE